MALLKDNKSGIIDDFGRGSGDTGSPEVQIALLSATIEKLQEHFSVHQKDRASRRGLIGMVNKRRKLLDYLKRHHVSRYQVVIRRLGLRH